MAPELLSWLLTGSAANAEKIIHLCRRYPIALYGYRRVAVKHADYPALIPSPSLGDSVAGYLIYPRGETDRKKIDDFEGESYCRQIVSVNLQDDDGGAGGSRVQAYAYIWAGETDVLWGEREWVFERFRERRLEDWIDSFVGMEMIG